MRNEQILNIVKPAKVIMYEIKDMVQTYTTAMSCTERKGIRDVDSKDIRDFALPKQEEINTILEAVLDLAKDKAEKEKVQKCVEQNRTIKDHLNHLVKDDFNMDQINSEVRSLSGMIHRLIESYE
jgi:hypothetical protein